MVLLGAYRGSESTEYCIYNPMGIIHDPFFLKKWNNIANYKAVGIYSCLIFFLKMLIFEIYPIYRSYME